MRLILVRHGLTASNVSGTIPLAADPEQLVPEGERQMERTGVRLRAYAPAHVVSSGAARARQSAEIVATALGVAVEIVAGLEERSWGELGGTSWAALQERLGEMTIDERYTYLPPGGESWQQVEARLGAAIRGLRERYVGETVIVVTHGGVLRCLVPYLLKLPREEGVRRTFDNASITVLDIDGESVEPVLVNGTAHLS